MNNVTDVNHKIAIDLGASSTRFWCQGDSDISCNPNNAIILDDMKPVSISQTMHSGKLVDSLELIINKTTGDSDYFPAHVLFGNLASSFISDEDKHEKPAAKISKIQQRINYLSVILSVVNSKINHENLDSTHLYITLPPVEQGEDIQYFIDNLVGSYEVELPKYKGGMTLSFNIPRIEVLEESVMAVYSWMFGDNGQPTENFEKYSQSSILTIDIGASTTDLCIVKSGHLLADTASTVEVGGKMISANLRQSIRRAPRAEGLGFMPDVDQCELAVIEGRLQVGAKYKDISKLLVEAKKNVSKAISSQISSYFDEIGVNIQTISVVVLCGGGSMNSEYKDANGNAIITTSPMSTYIEEHLKNLCPDIEVCYYEDGARFANIKGLILKSRVDAQKEREQRLQANFSNVPVQAQPPQQPPMMQPPQSSAQ